MPIVQVPLSPEVELEIQESLGQIDDPVERLAFEEKLRALRQAEANSGATYRRHFRDALEEARAGGYADPEGFAKARADNLTLGEQYERRVAAIQKRVKAKVRGDANRIEKKREVASKSARPELRRFPQNDRRYVEILGKAEKEGWLEDVPLVVTKIRTELGVYKPPHWDKTTTPLKVMAMSVDLAKRGARTINLRLSPDVCSQAASSPRGPAGYVQNRIREAFKREFAADAPEFWFVVERDNDSRFHLHGAVECPNEDLFAEGIDAALRRAGGYWNSAGGHHHQQVSRTLTDPFWWAHYVTKDLNVTALSIERKLMGSTSEIRAVARGGWDGLRSGLPQT